MFYDMHVHSVCSSDSALEMEVAVHRALELGLAGLAFTDHLDLDFTGHETEFHCDFAQYFTKIRDMQERYRGRIEILTGVEIGLQPHVLRDTAELLAPYTFDYAIGSTHLIHHCDPYDGTYFTGKSKSEAYHAYLEEIYHNLQLYHDFTTLGHFDYLVRYAKYPDNTMYYDEQAELLDAILQFLVAHSIALEINTRTYDAVALDRRILERYRELGGELLVLGSDAHRVTRIGTRFAETAALLYDCGFRYLAYYKNGVPVFYSLQR